MGKRPEPGKKPPKAVRRAAKKRLMRRGTGSIVMSRMRKKHERTVQRIRERLDAEQHLPGRESLQKAHDILFGMEDLTDARSRTRARKELVSVLRDCDRTRIQTRYDRDKSHQLSMDMDLIEDLIKDL